MNAREGEREAEGKRAGAPDHTKPSRLRLSSIWHF